MEFRTDVTLGLKSPLMPPIMNGGGCIKTVEHVREAAMSVAGAVVVGSFTVSPRGGNKGDTFWYNPTGTLNSLGMPNGGMPYLVNNLSEMADICHTANKPLVVNIAGFYPDEYVVLTSLCSKLGADAIELNLGCPNVLQDDGSRKPIPSYNVELFEKILSNVGEYAQIIKPLWVKVSPNFDGDQIRKLAQIVNQYHLIIKAVTIINTVPNCYSVDEEGKSRITVGMAGLSGPPLKYIGLGQVWQWRQALPETVSVIGVGGISKGEDVRDYAAVGASAFQVTTELLKSGDFNPRSLERLVTEYSNL